MIRTAFALTLFCLAGIAAGEDRRTDTAKLTVMTFNTLFMWDGVAPEEGSVHDFPWRDSQTEAEEHMEKLAAVIKAASPDIVNLVELENLHALETLNTKFLAGQGYKAYLIDGKDTATGQDVGLLTRIDPEGGAIERDDSTATSGPVTKGVSKNYFAKFDVGGKKIALVALHLLARPNDPTRSDQRQAQAKVITARARDLAATGFAPIVLGDFNDYDGDVKDHLDDVPVTNVLATVRAMDPVTPADDLYNVAACIPKANRYTSFFDRNEDGDVDAPGELTSIDHLLIAPSLVGLLESAEIPHALDPTKVSDHFPIVARFNLAGGVTCGPPVTPQPGTPTPGAPTPMPPVPAGLRITRLLPNPPGNENQNEEASLKNGGAADVNLAGYRLRDAAGAFWDLTGTLAAGQSKTFRRDGKPMAMNNTGDTIELVSPAGAVLDSVTYGRVAEDEEVLH